jgi:hypothetical protein
MLDDPTACGKRSGVALTVRLAVLRVTAALIGAAGGAISLARAG